MMKMKQPYLTYAVDSNGKLVHVDDVPKGKACGCFCPNCKERLLARQGEKRKHHFSHLSGTECEHAYESMLHLLAKEKVQKAFYEQLSFYIEFEYTSYCSNVNCIFKSDFGKCSQTSRRRFDIKKWYDSCKQEKAYDNITRRSDLVFFSKGHPNVAPIYIEFCVTHASDDAKLNSGNRIIETIIETEEDINAIVKEGLVEKQVPIDEFAYRFRQITAFYGFKKYDNNNNMSSEVPVIRFVLYQSGKIFCTYSSCNCKAPKRTYHNSLCEIIMLRQNFDTITAACDFAKYIAYQKFGIKNCEMCSNYVPAWSINARNICKLYKHLQMPKWQFDMYGGFDSSIAKTCKCFNFDIQEQQRQFSFHKDTFYIVL